MKVLVTGGCGFVGSNMAAEAMSRGCDVTVFDNLYRGGGAENLEWLRGAGRLEFFHGDIRNQHDVSRLIERVRPGMVFHLAGQVAMTTSLADPRLDFEVNALGSFNVLEAVRRHVPSCGVLYSSTNKVYGDLEQYSYRETATRFECVDRPAGFDESTPLDFHSPYGCSKGAADQYMRDYARMFGLKTVVFRHSSIYGGRQHATVDQGWIGWFCQKALEIQQGQGSGEVSISGTGKQVRDVLHVSDVQQLYFRAVERLDAVAGEAFNVGGGVANSLSLIELLALLGQDNATDISIQRGAPRQGDQRVFIADSAKAARLLGWRAEVSYRQGIAEFLSWLRTR